MRRRAFFKFIRQAPRRAVQLGAVTFIPLICYAGLLSAFYLDLQDTQAKPLAMVIGLILQAASSLFISLALDRHLHSSDQVLMQFTPLRLELYYWRNLMRIGAPLLGCVGFFPLLLGGAGFFFLGYDNDWKYGYSNAAALGVNLCLVWWLFLLVPLHERVTGKRWTHLFFLPRGLLARWRMKIRKFGKRLTIVIAAGLIYLIVLVAQESPRNVVGPALRDIAERGNPLVDLIHWVVSPLTAVLSVHVPGGSHGNPWILALMQATLLGLIGTATWKQWHASPEEWERKTYDQWREWNETVEELGDVEAEKQEAKLREKLPGNLARDSDEEAVLNIENEPQAAAAETIEPERIQPEAALEFETPTHSALYELAMAAMANRDSKTLEYDPTLSPEEQIARHQKFWYEVRGLRPPRRKLYYVLTTAILLIFAVVCLAVNRLDVVNIPVGALLFIGIISTRLIFQMRFDNLFRTYGKLFAFATMPIHWKVWFKRSLEREDIFSFARQVCVALLIAYGLRLAPGTALRLCLILVLWKTSTYLMDGLFCLYDWTRKGWLIGMLRVDIAVFLVLALAFMVLGVQDWANQPSIHFDMRALMNGPFLWILLIYHALETGLYAILLRTRLRRLNDQFLHPEGYNVKSLLKKF